MTDATPEQLVRAMRRYVAAIQELIDEYERGFAPPPPPRLTVINGTDRKDQP